MNLNFYQCKNWLAQIDQSFKIGGANVTGFATNTGVILLNEIFQNPNDDYSLSGANIVFSTAPASGLDFFGTILGTDLSLNTITDSSVTPATLSNGGPSWAGDGTVGISSGLTVVGVANFKNSCASVIYHSFFPPLRL